MTPDGIVKLFFDEAADLLREFEGSVLALERAPDDAEALNRVFRSAHTLKGTSGMLGFGAVSRFTHLLEDLLLRLRTRELSVSAPVIGLLLHARDAIAVLLERARSGDPEDATGMDDVVAALATCHASPASAVPEGAQRVAATPASPASRDEPLHLVTFTPPPDLFTRGLDPIRLLDGLTAVGTVIEIETDTSRLPALARMEPEQAYLGFRCWLRTSASHAAIAACFDFVGDPAAVSIEAPRAAAPSPATSSVAPVPEARIRVSAAKVDDLIDLVGELVVTQSMIAELVDDGATGHSGRLHELVAQMSRHTRELEARAMAMRMVPIRTLFSRFTRIVRDLAQASGKEVVLETSGEETELDRSLIEQMTDPLTHLLRNAVDHGLEPPDRRRDAGKPEAGRLTLAAYHRGGNVFIEVADDGHGLDRDRIIAKARALGWLGATESIGDDDAYAMIFRAGFTTAEHLSEMSGRGVGMDVVVKNVRAAGGTIALQTTAGRGTRFTIKLPLTVASFDGQAVRVGGEIYVLPLLAIVESIRPACGDVRTVAGTGEALVLRGEIIPLVRLARVIGTTPTAEEPAGSLIVIVEDGSRRLAFLVDELLSQQHVVIKSLETNFVRVDGIAGATVLGDGRVALILDVAGIVARWRAGSAAVPAANGACP